jgi:hypothetical protein
LWAGHSDAESRQHRPLTGIVRHGPCRKTDSPIGSRVRAPGTGFRPGERPNRARPRLNDEPSCLTVNDDRRRWPPWFRTGPPTLGGCACRPARAICGPGSRRFCQKKPRFAKQATEGLRRTSAPTNAPVDKVLEAADVSKTQIAGAGGIARLQGINDLILKA